MSHSPSNAVSVSFRLLVLLLAALSPAAAQASLLPGSVEYTFSGSDNDGKLSATAIFTPISGGIEITLTNTETGTIAKGQAISALSFAVDGTHVKEPTAFTELKGTSVPSASFTGGTFPGSVTQTPFDDHPSQPNTQAIDHWGFAPNGNLVSLATAGSSVSGATGHPHYMILPSSGTYNKNGKSLSDSQFDPYILGPAEFFLTVPGITSKTNLFDSSLNPYISGVTLGFGTEPDKTIRAASPTIGTSNTNPVPAPPSYSLLAIGGLFLWVGVHLRGRRQALLA